MGEGMVDALGGLRSPFNFALEKALRRHVSKRTETARELWRDLKSSAIEGDLSSSQSELPFAQGQQPALSAGPEIETDQSAVPQQE